MGKRSNFERKPRDFYRTPREAVLPLMPHLEAMIYAHGKISFIEPCAGKGDLTTHLLDALHPAFACVGEYDIADTRSVDARTADYDVRGRSIFITNPPWKRSILHPIIENLVRQAPTWLLFDADWAHTKQAVPYMQLCLRIVSVGRVSWQGNGVTGKDNCCWYLFSKDQTGPTKFFPRVQGAELPLEPWHRRESMIVNARSP